MTTVTPKRFSLAEYHRLIELGFFQGNERVELIRGQIIQMAAKGTPHSVCNTLLFGELFTLLQGQATIRNQEPIILGNDSEPEPDLVIVRNRGDRYLDSHPGIADILLVIEVSDSTLKYDQETKLSLYAESGIDNYWLFNLVANCLEAYSQPFQITGKFEYARKQVYLPSAAINLPFSTVTLDLSKVFP
ncbi:Uma2 family endonuclease [Synechocystis sp. PCC 7509]|uniref:Uma2 family endonuclease n=1 Tax=Synechocystis sp. PCC 7509 TaxID=927677 RepID=UPI0002ABBF13|nr:Uma2 family endonuclease [Synechocystis sp. PCC 7509]